MKDWINRCLVRLQQAVSSAMERLRLTLQSLRSWFKELPLKLKAWISS